tara:strand:+ start:194 stop:481 length:288 start_codon:yes stop_codon:yes gene_type:complete
MDFIELLTKISSDLDDYEDPGFDDSNLEGLVQSLEAICDEFDDNTTKLEWDLYNQCDIKVDTAERFFEGVYEQEAIDQEQQEREEREYESFKQFQ